MHVTVYTAPHCHGCRYTKRDLEKYGIPYSSKDLSQDDELLEKIKKEVLDRPEQKLKLPVVRADFGDGATCTFQGYSPSKIENLKKHLDGFDPEAAA